ncbi:MAG: acetolactate synthase [Bacteroidales bacterium]|jgi:hypothetical protein|nr:acetolactate synthase [Bacteroidales bacterium]
MTTIQQLSVFLENKSGRLTEVLEILDNEQIRIITLTIADTLEYGILRLIVSDPEKGYELLKLRDFRVSLTDVVTLQVSPSTASYAVILKKLSEAQLSVEYIYAFSSGQKSIIVLRADDHSKALDVVKNNRFAVIGKDELNRL